MKHTSEITAAYQYVNTRYVFTPDHYPEVLGMTPKQIQLFALKHAMFHLFKHVSKLIMFEGINSVPTTNQFFLKDCDVTSNNFIGYKKSLVKMIVNILKIAEILEISAEEMSVIEPKFCSRSNSLIWSSFGATVSTELEDIDHTGRVLDIQKMREATKEVFADALYFFEAANIPIPWEMISEVMKSK